MIVVYRPFVLVSGTSASALYWKPLSRPTDHPTSHAAYLRESSLLQEPHGGDAAVSAPADEGEYELHLGYTPLAIRTAHGHQRSLLQSAASLSPPQALPLQRPVYEKNCETRSTLSSIQISLTFIMFVQA